MVNFAFKMDRFLRLIKIINMILRLIMKITLTTSVIQTVKKIMRILLAF